MTHSFTFTGEAPTEFLNVNDRRLGPHERRLVGLWRADAWARYNAIVRKTKPVGLATFRLEIGTRLPNQRRDPMNWYSTAKALIDGLTDARVWPDDDTEHVLVAQPRFVDTDVLPHNHYRVTVTWEIP